MAFWMFHPLVHLMSTSCPLSCPLCCFRLYSTHGASVEYLLFTCECPTSSSRWQLPVCGCIQGSICTKTVKRGKREEERQKRKETRLRSRPRASTLAHHLSAGSKTRVPGMNTCRLEKSKTGSFFLFPFPLLECLCRDHPAATLPLLLRPACHCHIAFHTFYIACHLPPPLPCLRRLPHSLVRDPLLFVLLFLSSPFSAICVHLYPFSSPQPSRTLDAACCHSSD